MAVNRRRTGVWIVAAAAAAWVSYTGAHAAPGAGAAQGGTGTIKGRVKLMGPAPANTIIRMGMDPMCARVNAGKRVTQQTVVTGAEGGLANTLVRVEGSLPAGTPPADPVIVNQKGCVYTPRVVGAQAGQTLRVINSDTLVHNVHIANSTANAFDITQPQSGMVYNHVLKKDDTILKLACRVHSWMTAFVAVVPHPFFAVTDDSGTFTIARVPPGKYTLQTWHERYGKLTKTVEVTAGGTATINFDYTGSEKPQAALIPTLNIPLE